MYSPPDLEHKWIVNLGEFCVLRERGGGLVGRHHPGINRGEVIQLGWDM